MAIHTNKTSQAQVDQAQGAAMHANRIGLAACRTIEQLRGWLDAANVEYLSGAGAAQFDHESLVDAAKRLLKGGS